MDPLQFPEPVPSPSFIPPPKQNHFHRYFTLAILGALALFMVPLSIWTLTNQTTENRSQAQNPVTPTMPPQLLITVCPVYAPGCDFYGTNAANSGDAIQAALDAAPIGTPTAPTIIQLKSGNYSRQTYEQYVYTDDDGVDHLRKTLYHTRGKNFTIRAEDEAILDGINSTPGTGIYAGAGSLNLYNLIIFGMRADNITCFDTDTTQPCSRGNGLFVAGTVITTLTSNQIQSNADDGLSVSGSATATITSNQIHSNENNGIAVYESATATITNNFLKVNHDGLYLAHIAQVSATHNVFDDNSVTGINVYHCLYDGVEHNPALYARNNIILNTKFDSGGNYGNGIGVECNTDPGKLDNDNIDYNLFYNNSGENTPGFDPPNDLNNIDPQFISTTDYHLQSDSPAIDAGDPTLLDPDGSRSDMGAYGGPGACGLDPELPGCDSLTPTPSPTPTTPPRPGDVNRDGRVDALDYSIFFMQWDKPVPPGDPRCDFNGNNIVDSVDYVTLYQNWDPL